MDLSFYLQLMLYLSYVDFASCWQYFTSYHDLKQENSGKTALSLHSEYIYGECNRKDIKLYTTIYLDAAQVLGKVIVRGWLNIPRIPVCIKLRAFATFDTMGIGGAYNFQMCVPRITYCHSRRRYKYFFYEWFIPVDFQGGQNWMLLFYGPQEMAW